MSDGPVWEAVHPPTAIPYQFLGDDARHRTPMGDKVDMLQNLCPWGEGEPDRKTDHLSCLVYRRSQHLGWRDSDHEGCLPDEDIGWTRVRVAACSCNCHTGADNPGWREWWDSLPD